MILKVVILMQTILCQSCKILIAYRNTASPVSWKRGHDRTEARINLIENGLVSQPSGGNVLQAVVCPEAGQAVIFEHKTAREAVNMTVPAVPGASKCRKAERRGFGVVGRVEIGHGRELQAGR